MDEATKIQFERIDDENNRQNHRIDSLEKSVAEFRSIALSVEKLALTMEHMLVEQQKQGQRLDVIERQPAEAWLNTKKIVINTIIGAIAGAIGVGLIALIAQSI